MQLALEHAMSSQIYVQGTEAQFIDVIGSMSNKRTLLLATDCLMSLRHTPSKAKLILLSFFLVSHTEIFAKELYLPFNIN